jgi:anti-sigma regulatory factor (Ser/Thr protein kinase)
MRHARSFSRDPGSVAAARRFAVETLSGVELELLSSVELMVSELATNCLRHADSAFELSVVHEREQIRIEVRDSGGGEPTLLSPTPDDPDGRGLQIVNMLSEAWGVKWPAGAGKMVWFELSADAAQSDDEPDAVPAQKCGA